LLPLLRGLAQRDQLRGLAKVVTSHRVSPPGADRLLPTMNVDALCENVLFPETCSWIAYRHSVSKGPNSTYLFWNTEPRAIPWSSKIPSSSKYDAHTHSAVDGQLPRKWHRGMLRLACSRAAPICDSNNPAHSRCYQSSKRHPY